jgi:hypothetical protein
MITELLGKLWQALLPTYPPQRWVYDLTTISREERAIYGDCSECGCPLIPGAALLSIPCENKQFCHDCMKDKC